MSRLWFSYFSDTYWGRKKISNQNISFKTNTAEAQHLYGVSN